MLKTRTLIAAILLALAAPGCAAKSYSSGMSAPDVMAESADYGGGDADGVADYYEMEEAAPSAPMAPPAEPSPAMDMDFKRSERSASTGSSAGLAPAGSSVPERTRGPVNREDAKPSKPAAKESGSSAEPGKDESKEPEKVSRQIIYTAEMHLSVFKLDEAMARVEALALDVGGYVQQMREGFYVIRVPAARLRDVMNGADEVYLSEFDDSFRGFGGNDTMEGGGGMVTQRSLQARDVTEEFVDLTTRIRVLRETQLQLIDLLKKAKTVEEALHVRQALDQVTMELEQALGRLRMLENLIGFSTLTVYLEERGPQNNIPSSNDPFPWVDGLGVEATEWN